MKAIAMVAAMLAAGPTLAAPACQLPAAWATPRLARAALAEPLRYALRPGRAVNLALVETAKVKFAVSPGRKPVPASFGGLAALEVARGGTLSAALSERVYVDLVRDGKALVSVAHRDRCSGARKVVDFAVTPGRYLVQIADAPAARVRLLTFGG